MIKLLHNITSYFFKEHNTRYNLKQSYFSTPIYNTVTYSRHSLRYLGLKLRRKLSSNERSAKTLNVFERRIRAKDVIEAGCKGFILCLTSHFDLNIYIFNVHVKGLYLLILFCIFSINIIMFPH